MTSLIRVITVNTAATLTVLILDLVRQLVLLDSPEGAYHGTPDGGLFQPDPQHLGEELEERLPSALPLHRVQLRARQVELQTKLVPLGGYPRAREGLLQTGSGGKQGFSYLKQHSKAGHLLSKSVFL